MSNRAMKQSTCPNCGKRFQQWRQKRFCSERCRKGAQNVRLGYVRRDAAPTLADSPNPENIIQQNQRSANPFRRDERFEWTACNEITHKLTKAGSPDAVAWVFEIRDRGWFMRIKPDLCFGPATRIRAQKAAEATIMGIPFDKLEGEKSWRGTCAALL
jgi:hypothetical protein